MVKHTFKPIAAAVGAAFIASMAMSPLAQSAENPFQMTELSSGYQVTAADKDAEGKCGEGKCGEAKSSGEGKCGEGKCGDKKEAKADEEGKCGEGKCGGDMGSEEASGEEAADHSGH